MTTLAHIAYGLLWVGFGVLHSVLASATAKQRLRPLFGRAYRLSYNLFAAVHIGAVVIGGRIWIAPQLAGYDFPPMIRAALGAMALLGGIVLLLALGQYDLGRFSGLTQLRGGDATSGNAFDADEEPLHVTGLHRYVRHPLYTGAYLFLWGTVGSEFDLATAIWASLYLAIGSRFEEGRLIERFGDSYATYRSRVPAIIPWRGRAV